MSHKHSHANGWLPRLDRTAIVLSALCAVHCALTPVLLLGLPFVASHDFERGMRLILAVMGVVAVGIGTTLHRSWKAAALLALGLALFVVLELWGVHGGIELALSLVAAAFLVTAHVLNSLACRAGAAVSGASEGAEASTVVDRAAGNGSLSDPSGARSA